MSIETRDNPAVPEKEKAAKSPSPYPTVEVPEGEKPDLLSYLDSLPDLGVPLAPIPKEEKPEEPAVEKTSEQIKAEALAQRIRERTKASQVTSYSLLRGEDDGVDAVFGDLFRDNAYDDIVHTVGQKDTYYYSSKTMTANYATIAVLVEEKDIAHTVAHMVRFNCVTYPAPTPKSYFMHHPYNFTSPQLERVRDNFKRDEKYADLSDVVTKNGQLYFFSTDKMSRDYALSLAERAEYIE